MDKDLETFIRALQGAILNRAEQAWLNEDNEEKGSTIKAALEYLNSALDDVIPGGGDNG